MKLVKFLYNILSTIVIGLVIYFGFMIGVTWFKATNHVFTSQNVNAAEVWCREMKLECQAVYCQGPGKFTNCDVKYNNEVHSLNCNTEYCELRNGK